jgi:hypothetical protein
MDSPILTPEQRVRLRPTVDVAALERLLAVVPAETRASVLVACSAAPTLDEISALPGFPGGPHAAPACATGDRTSAGQPPRDATLAIAFKDPALQRLWQDVERRGR